MRDCENCKHRVMKVEVGKGTPPDHFWGCECWECEFEPAIKNDLGVDCISRERLKQIAFNITAEYNTETIHIDRLIDEIDNLPSVTPQEPKSEWEHDHTILKAYSDGANEVLAKIRAEIEQIIGERNLDDYDFCSGLICARKIIDKYKAESEG